MWPFPFGKSILTFGTLFLQFRRRKRDKYHVVIAVLLASTLRDSSITATRTPVLRARPILEALGFDRLTMAATRAQCLYLLGDVDAARLHAARFRKIAADMQIGPEHHTPLVAEAFVRVAGI